MAIKKPATATNKPKKLTKSETRVSYEKTVTEIQAHLVRVGAKKISFDYDEASLPCNITFSYPTKSGLMLFSLPLRFQGVSKIMAAQGGSSRGGEMQPVNTAWRILKDWIISQLALVEADLAELPEVFFAYGVTPQGGTIYETLKENSNQVLFLNQTN